MLVSIRKLAPVLLLLAVSKIAQSGGNYELVHRTAAQAAPRKHAASASGDNKLEQHSAWQPANATALKAGELATKKKRHRQVAHSHDHYDPHDHALSANSHYDYYDNRNPNYLDDSLISCCRSGRKVALTFDDGPDDYTRQLLDILDEEHVKATFFVLGKNIESDERCRVVGKAHQRGHLIGSHTYDHSYLTELSHDDMAYQMDRTAKLISSCTGGYWPRYMRPPYGACNRDVIDMLQAKHYKIVLWNLDPEDWQTPLSKQRVDDFLSWTDKNDPASKSKILLLHDIQHSTVNNIRSVIQLLKSYGYSFVTLENC